MQNKWALWFLASRANATEREQDKHGSKRFRIALVLSERRTHTVSPRSAGRGLAPATEAIVLDGGGPRTGPAPPRYRAPS